MNTRPKKRIEIVYGERGGELILIPKERAERLATIWEALNESTTWGEFKNRTPLDVYREVIELVKDSNEEGGTLPKDGDAFNADDIPGLPDGDWPGWPAQEMIDWIPEDVQRKFGKIQSSVLNGEFLHLDSTRKREIIMALGKHGFVCTEDVRLIARSCGDDL